MSSDGFDVLVGGLCITPAGDTLDCSVIWLGILDTPPGSRFDTGQPASNFLSPKTKNPRSKARTLLSTD